MHAYIFSGGLSNSIDPAVTETFPSPSINAEVLSNRTQNGLALTGHLACHSSRSDQAGHMSSTTKRGSSEAAGGEHANISSHTSTQVGRSLSRRSRSEVSWSHVLSRLNLKNGRADVHAQLLQLLVGVVAEGELGGLPASADGVAVRLHCGSVEDLLVHGRPAQRVHRFARRADGGGGGLLDWLRGLGTHLGKEKKKCFRTVFSDFGEAKSRENPTVLGRREVGATVVFAAFGQF
mmetsp:Transcript_8382/g.18175  ORF Transcript_8382/g.18175 Transcript_8382/m.18175 type:complete len:235 (+) Transcript_8382:1-705(+)